MNITKLVKLNLNRPRNNENVWPQFADLEGWILSLLRALTVDLRTAGGDVGADVGDTNVTLTVGSSARTQRYNSPITAGRTVTLSTVGAVSGDFFDVIRQAGATGAFNISVGGLKNLTAASQGVRVMFDGSAWFEHSTWSL